MVGPSAKVHIRSTVRPSCCAESRISSTIGRLAGSAAKTICTRHTVIRPAGWVSRAAAGARAASAHQELRIGARKVERLAAVGLPICGLHHEARAAALDELCDKARAVACAHTLVQALRQGQPAHPGAGGCHAEAAVPDQLALVRLRLWGRTRRGDRRRRLRHGGAGRECHGRRGSRTDDSCVSTGRLEAAAGREWSRPYHAGFTSPALWNAVHATG